MSKEERRKKSDAWKNETGAGGSEGTDKRRQGEREMREGKKEAERRNGERR